MPRLSGGRPPTGAPLMRISPALGCFEPGQHHQAGGLAGSRRSQQGQEFAALHVKVKIAHDPVGPVVGLAHVDVLDVGSGGVVVHAYPP